MESAWFDPSTGISGSGILMQELFSWDKFIYIFQEMSMPFYLPLHPHACDGGTCKFFPDGDAAHPLLNPGIPLLCRSPAFSSWPAPGLLVPAPARSRPLPANV